MKLYNPYLDIKSKPDRNTRWNYGKYNMTRSRQCLGCCNYTCGCTANEKLTNLFHVLCSNWRGGY